MAGPKKTNYSNLKDGETVRHSDGSWSERRGDTVWHSDGSWSENRGDTTWHSDGSWSDSNGRNSDGSWSDNGGSGGCYLTTACVVAKNLPDDCEELTALRNFRDTYLRNHENGEEDILHRFCRKAVLLS